MGGVEHVQFAHRNDTPIVKPGHCGHPTELVKRGYVDGKGWPKRSKKQHKFKTFKWPDGDHFYATVDGCDVQLGDTVKWDSEAEAIRACNEYIRRMGL